MFIVCGRGSALCYRVADSLRARGVRVFYDDYERVELRGKDLYVHLDDIFKTPAVPRAGS
jgi:hypothetical protein